MNQDFGSEYLDAVEQPVTGGELAGGIAINPIGVSGISFSMRNHIIAP